MNSLKNWSTTTAQLTRRGFVPRELQCALRNAAVLMVAFMLVMVVATRYTDYSDTGAQINGPVAHRHLENTRQHIENTNYVFTFEFANPVRLEPPPGRRIAINGTPLIKVLYGEDLYNRPPPSLS
jgi:hypothetical protein